MIPSVALNPTSTDTPLRRRVAGLFLVGWDGHAPGVLTPQVGGMLRRGLRGVVLFARNVVSLGQVRELVAHVHMARGAGGLVGIDQEGGRVARLREGLFLPPSMATLGRHADARLAHDVGHLVGAQLRALGINLNFAPVLDVDTNPANPVIGDRSFGRDPARVAALGVALARGLQAAGVAACGKHFPGHGDTLKDSHHDLPRLAHGRERLDRVELPPFRAAIADGIASIMTAHIVFEAMDAHSPATLSRAVVQGLLRDELGYDGVVVSDDLEMRAIADRGPLAESAVRAIAAGVDLLLVCHHPDLAERAIDAVVAAVESGALPSERVDAAFARVEAMAGRYSPTGGVPVAGPSELAAARRDIERRLAALAGGEEPPPGRRDPTDYRVAATPTADH